MSDRLDALLSALPLPAGAVVVPQFPPSNADYEAAHREAAHGVADPDDEVEHEERWSGME